MMYSVRLVGKNRLIVDEHIDVQYTRYIIFYNGYNPYAVEQVTSTRHGQSTRTVLKKTLYYTKALPSSHNLIGSLGYRPADMLENGNTRVASSPDEITRMAEDIIMKYTAHIMDRRLTS